MAIINGTNLNNVLFGTGLTDAISGLGGDDLINAGNGDDFVDAGTGNDTVLGEAGTDSLKGSGGDDVIFGGAGNDTIDGDDASNLFQTGNDILDGGDGNDLIGGGAGDDIIYANSGFDTVFGGTGNDEYFLHGDFAAGAVFVSDQAGIDTLNFSLASTGVDVQLSTDTSVVIQTASVDGRTIHLGANGVAGLPSAQPSTFENAIGTSSGDRIAGNEVANTLQGGDGNDRLFGAAGNDTLLAGTGVDYLSGGVRSTLHAITLNSTVPNTPIDNFKLTFESFDPGGDQAPGTGTSARVRVSFDIYTNSSQTISHTTFSFSVSVNGFGTDFLFEGNDALFDEYQEVVSTGMDGGVFAKSFDLIVTGLTPGASNAIGVQVIADNYYDAGEPIFVGDVLAQQFTVDQTVTPASGDDLLDGGANGDGVTTMRGADGNDTYYIRDAADLVQENSNDGIDTVQSEVDYTLPFAVEDLMLLGGEAGAGTGNGLDNSITGSFANNTLNGVGGNDTINGGLGDDFIDGGTGNDAMTGGDGNDTFVVRDAGDTIIEALGLGSGVDTAISNLVSYTLAANVEKGELDAVFGTNLTGNALDNALGGNGGNNVLNGGLGNDFMSGGIGNDTYIVAQTGDVVQENLLNGTDLVVSSLAAYTLTANVENLTLTTGGVAGTGNTQDNVITGNTVANALNGGNGNDTINGGTGDDTMNGGAGNDTFVIDSLNDIIVDVSGVDTVLANFNATLQFYTTVENLTLTGFAFQGVGNALGNRIVGTSLDNNLAGQDGDDTLEGGAGSDTLIGGIGNDRLDGGAGIDAMTGGDGNDVYIIDTLADSVTEAAGGGTADRVESTTSVTTLAAEVENLTLLGTLSLNGTGNGLANRITGNSGNNTLDGAGGVDILTGGLGNDVYRVDVAGETVFESFDQGTDRVESLVTYALGSHVENLTLLGADNINANGNGLVNIINGNNGNNVINGGLGADDMRGGGGNDTYIVDDLADVVFETNVAGVDLVQSGVTFTLALFVENLNLTGTGNVNGTGNGAANIINGNSGNNTLDGGAGADTLIGAGGNDIYIVDNILDSVIDAGGTADEVRASVTRTLEATIENLTLTGANAINGTGNTLANTILGNDQANTLDGKAGADTLTGGLGADRFQFTVLQNLADTITDFQDNIDRIAISASAFGGGLVAGGAVDFRFSEIGDPLPTPTGTNGQFLFSDSTSELYWDQNGATAGGLFFIAVVNGGAGNLFAGDFVVIP